MTASFPLQLHNCSRRTSVAYRVRMENHCFRTIDPPCRCHFIRPPFSSARTTSDWISDSALSPWPQLPFLRPPLIARISAFPEARVTAWPKTMSAVSPTVDPTEHGKQAREPTRCGVRSASGGRGLYKCQTHSAFAKRVTKHMYSPHCKLQVIRAVQRGSEAVAAPLNWCRDLPLQWLPASRVGQ